MPQLALASQAIHEHIGAYAARNCTLVMIRSIGVNDFAAIGARQGWSND